VTDSAEAVPAWLAAWRERQSQPPPAAQPPAQRDQQGRQGCNGDPVPNAAVAPAQPDRPKANFQGFIEPERWSYDGGVRREPVVDADRCPPRVVRKVGWRNCMACGVPFFSEDVVALRLCDGPEGCRDQTPMRYKSKAAT
jgi:hypothetical protein